MKDWIIRALKTFVQATVAYFVANIALISQHVVDWDFSNWKGWLMPILVGALFDIHAGGCQFLIRTSVITFFIHTISRGRPLNIYFSPLWLVSSSLLASRFFYAI